MSARDAQALRARREAPTLDPARAGATADPSAPGAAGTTSGAALASGSCVGDWRVEGPLPGGAGSQAELYEVRSGGRRGVLKRYHAGFSPVSGVVRAQRAGEARHLVPLWDEGAHEGRRFEVYPHYLCSTLEELVASGGAGEAFAREVLVPQLADALAFLGERGILHADLAPANVLVMEGAREVRLADFGVALPVPAPGELVERRGTAGFSPRVRGRGSRVELGRGYDYGSLGLLVAYACLGVSPIAGLDERRAAAVLADGSAFSALPEDLMRLCVALSSPLGGAGDGAAACVRFMGSGAEKNAAPPAAPEAARSAGSLEFGLVDGRVVVVASARELLERAERHWDAARGLVASPRLEVFLGALDGGERVLALVREAARAGADAQVLALCCALRCLLDGPGAGPLCWLGRTYGSVVELLREAAEGSGDAERFVREGLLSLYVRAAGLPDAVVAEAERLARAPGDARSVARSAVEVLTGTGAELVADGRAIEDVAALARWVAGASLEQVSELVEGSVLRGWLYRRGLDDVYREVDSIA